MSFTITLSGASSTLSANFFPPIELSGDNYELGMVDFQTYNSIPNIDEHRNNKFQYNGGAGMVTIPTGSYELDELVDYIRDALQKNSDNFALKIVVNEKTLKSHVKCSTDIDFTANDSVGRLLGFRKRRLIPNIEHESDFPVRIQNLNAIRIECDVVTGAYHNGVPKHTIHQFSPNVPSGYKLVQVPSPIIYLPVVARSIDRLTIDIVDQDGDPVNFRGEIITIRLHLLKRVR